MKKIIIAIIVCLVLLFSCEEVITDSELGTAVETETEFSTYVSTYNQTEAEEIFLTEETEDFPIETDPPHVHTFSSATCTTPKTCDGCGATEGSAAGHSFSNVTCTAAKTCSVCGITEGSALGHKFSEPTCTTPKTCENCGVTEGDAMGHYYSEGKCTNCGGKDPSYVPEVMVWIPTNGGTKYHSKKGCSSMIDPIQVTKSNAISQGFGPCGRCY